MTKAFIGLGSNIGERESNLRRAIEGLDSMASIQVTKISSFYETEPVGEIRQPDFLNAVAEIETTLSPLQLLAVTKNIEKRQGRRRGPRWGPRLIDLDILAFDCLQESNADLNLPHAEAKKRAFVLVPWAEIAPDHILSDNKSISDLLARLSDRNAVKLYRQRSEGPIGDEG